MKIILHCTDKNQYVDGEVLNHRPKAFLEVALNTVKLRMTYMNKCYVGSMAGLEFTVKEDDVPKEQSYKEFTRKR
jgi:hypothetical protein